MNYVTLRISNSPSESEMRHGAVEIILVNWEFQTFILSQELIFFISAQLAQSVEHEQEHESMRVVGSSPTLGALLKDYFRFLDIDNG